MANGFLSQKKFERLLKDLQNNRVESSNIDAKSQLNLSELGDKATLIRHIVAIANTGQAGHLLIGIEDKSWKVIGIPEGSLLKNADETQKQINQLLVGRVDPPIAISYRTYSHNDYSVGLVNIPAGHPPYIISISEDMYGGKKSESNKESHIHKGAIYIRRGSDSVIANRQAELFAVLEGRIDIFSIIGSLGLIAIIVSVGVGIAVSSIKFADVHVPAILGGAWGLIIGFLFNNRVKDSLGKFPKNLFASIFRGSLGPSFGMLVGAWLGFHLVRVILSMNAKILDPLSMGLVIAPLILLMNFLPAICVLFILEFLQIGRWIGQIFDRFQNKRVRVRNYKGEN